MKIVIASSEVVPFAKTGGLADVAGALPLFLEQAGDEVIVVMPGYACIRESGAEIQRLSDTASFSEIGKAIKVYFIEHEGYFGRSGLYQDGKGSDYPDNAERFAFYCDRTLGLLKEIGFCPDIIHLHDWQAALIAVYLKTRYAKDPWFSDIRTLLTIHNLGYQGIFARDNFEKLNLPQELFDVRCFEFFGMLNILKGGIVHADLLNTVSPTYSREIQTDKLGFGLQDVLRTRQSCVFGILNGLDYTLWNPETDHALVRNYSVDALEHKGLNKKALQEYCGFNARSDVPLFGMVSRLAEQKGIHLITDSFEEIAALGAQTVILGVGEEKFHIQLRQLAHRYQDNLKVILRFNDDLARRIYAGSDLFLMPSEYEPCGLGQMISLRYGSLPAVFKTGGLVDTVDERNGFVFDEYTSASFLRALKKAVAVFASPAQWRKLAVTAMKCRFSWEDSCKKYRELYATTCEI